MPLPKNIHISLRLDLKGLPVAYKKDYSEQRGGKNASYGNAAYGRNAHRIERAAEKAHEAPQRACKDHYNGRFIFSLQQPS